MHILLTNDDGIHAPGIDALHKALIAPAPLGEVFTVAPLTVQSATSHGVTFHSPLMTKPVDLNAQPGTAVDGRPADCVKLALTNLWAQRYGEGARPDLVISGMNAGANCGINVIYSGTVAAAIEAAFLGVPSIAVSLYINYELWSAGKGPDFALAATHARRAIDAVLAGGLPAPHTCININIPRMDDESPDDTPPLVVCPMNAHGHCDQFEQRRAPDGQAYYWSISGGFDFRNIDAGSDVDLLFKRCITVTPLTYDLTQHTTMQAWAQRLDSVVAK